MVSEFSTAPCYNLSAVSGRKTATKPTLRELQIFSSPAKESNRRWREQRMFMFLFWRLDSWRWRQYTPLKHRDELIQDTTLHSRRNEFLYSTLVIFTDIEPYLVSCVPECIVMRGLGQRSGWGAALLVGRSRDRFPVISLGFFSDISLSDRTIALGSTQPLLKMGTRNISRG
jgi:hypothetical protein